MKKIDWREQMEKGELDKSFKELAQVLAMADSPELIENFLKSLLTDNEVYEVTTRWALVRLLDQGVTQRNIAEKLSLSLCKITRGSKELQADDSPFKTLIDLLNENS